MKTLSKQIEEAMTMAIIAGTVMFGAACSGHSTPKPPGPYTACANDDNNLDFAGTGWAKQNS